jgi:hypothetical protein
MDLKKGYRVAIPSGTPIRGINSQPTVTKRRQIVTGNHVLTGYTRVYYDDNDRQCEEVIPPEVRWAGTGGYWKGVDINLVEKVEDE